MRSHPTYECSPETCGREGHSAANVGYTWLRWHHRFRQSWLGSAANCPEQARLMTINHLPDHNTDAAAVGTAMHAFIEASLSGVEFNLAMAEAEEAWWNEQREPNFTWVKYSGRTGWKMIESLCAVWFDKYDPYQRHNRGWELETPFLFTLHEDEKRIIEVSGTIDAYDGFDVTDWKSNASDDDRYVPREYERWAIQPTVYTRAALELWGHNPTFKYCVVSPTGLQQFSVVRDERDWAWLTDMCESYAYLIEAQLKSWPKNDQHWLCSKRWCPAWDTCKGRHYNNKENT